MALSGLAWVLGRLAIRAAWLHGLAWLLAGAGLLLQLILGILLAVEAYQD